MITIENLSFHYKKNEPILKNIGSNISGGHIYGLLGLNGAGKTTLLKLIAGLLFPKEGKITVNNHTPKDRKVSFLSDIYFITDEVELPNWSISTLTEIYSPLYPDFDLVYFQNMLDAFQIDKTKNIRDYSYGQRKKINIAFGLATNVSVVLMDEPTNGLDIPSKSQFRKIIAQHVTDHKIVILSTHQIRDVHHLIDHLLILDQNNLILDESIENLSKYIKFTTDPDEIKSSYYIESSIHRSVGIVPNPYQEDSPFDIELLFNAITNNKNIISKLKETLTANHE